MKRVAQKERETVVGIPPVVGSAIVVVQPALIVIGIDVEERGIAVRVVLYEAPSVPLRFECSHRCI